LSAIYLIDNQSGESISVGGRSVKSRKLLVIGPAASKESVSRKHEARPGSKESIVDSKDVARVGIRGVGHDREKSGDRGGSREKRLLAAESRLSVRESASIRDEISGVTMMRRDARRRPSGESGTALSSARSDEEDRDL